MKQRSKNSKKKISLKILLKEKINRMLMMIKWYKNTKYKINKYAEKKISH